MSSFVYPAGLRKIALAVANMDPEMSDARDAAGICAFCEAGHPERASEVGSWRVEVEHVADCIWVAARIYAGLSLPAGHTVRRAP